MKSLTFFAFMNAVISLCATIFCAHATASMVGDILTIERLYPDLNTQYQPSVSTTVVVGSSDVINPFGFELVDPESSHISIHWTRSSSYIGTNSVFDGYRFTGFSGVIQNVTASDVANITISELNFGEDFITLNLGSYFDFTSSLNLQVQFASVPEPATIWLFCFGLTFLLVARKNKFTA